MRVKREHRTGRIKGIRRNLAKCTEEQYELSR